MSAVEDAPKTNYRLRTELIGHTSDVRGVSCSPTGEIATSSRDSNVHLWNPNESSMPARTLSGHSHWVNAVLFLDSNRVATACADGSIRIWDSVSTSVLHDIAAHKQAACALASDGTRIISSSWDKSARLWDATSGMLLQTCTPHDAAVWASLPLPNGKIVTVAADKTVRLWPKGSGKSIVLATAHTDVVRGITPAPLGGFITVANDSALVYWKPTAGGEFSPVGGISNLHDGNFIYSVHGVEKDNKWTFVTSGEDNSVRVVKAIINGQNVDFECVQTIMHPGTVWDVEMCPNGELVTACSDGIARIFTTNPEVVANDDILAAFDKAVSSRKVSTKVIGGVDPSKLQTASDALSVPGTKDGQNKIVRSENGTPEVYMWSAAEQKWSKIGDVVDDPSGGVTPGTVLGKSYDFVFEVELGEAGPKKKLGFNRGENPFAAAQRFIDDNELNQDFLDQISTFITNQVPADAIGERSTGSDPFTGSGRYVPGGGPAAGSMRASDPLTGGNRYVPGGIKRPTTQSKPRHIPPNGGYVQFLTTKNVATIAKKLAELNETVRKELGVAGLIESEMDLFNTCLVPKLMKIANGQGGVVLEDTECALVEQIVQYPTEQVFASLDIARLLVGVPTGSAYFFGKNSGAILENVLEHARSAQAGHAVLIMACRFVCNMFGNRVVSSVARQNCSKVLNSCAPAAKSSNKRARETFAALLSNYSLLLLEGQAEHSENKVVVEAIIRAAEGEKEESVLYHLSVALGTLMSAKEETRLLGVQLGAAKLAADGASLSIRLQQTAEEMARLIVKT